jgi:hypothetical protein
MDVEVSVRVGFHGLRDPPDAARRGNPVTKRHGAAGPTECPRRFPSGFRAETPGMICASSRPTRMMPTSTLPVFPTFGALGMGTLLGVLCAGALGALLLGLIRHRRENRRATAIAMAESGAEVDAAPKASGGRLSA